MFIKRDQIVSRVSSTILKTSKAENISSSLFYTEEGFFNESLFLEESYEYNFTHRHRDFDIQEDYNKDELQEAIAALHLPVWSRGYIPCENPASEVSCKQIIKAWGVIRKWENLILSANASQLKYITRETIEFGTGNVVFTDTLAFGLALYSGRGFIADPRDLSTQTFSPDDKISQPVSSRGYEFPRIVHTCYQKFASLKNANSRNFPDDFQYQEKDIENLLSPSSATNYLIRHLHYPVFLYGIHGIGEFLFESFGNHFIYFINNYLTRFNETAIKHATQLYSDIPKDYVIIGCQLRHQYANSMYQKAPERQKNNFLKFARAAISHYNRKVKFVICSDNNDFVKSIENELDDYIICKSNERYNAPKIPEHIVDLTLLIASDEKLLTHRSTYSMTCGHRMNKASWYIEKESELALSPKYGQSLFADPMFHSDDICLGQTNMHLHITNNNNKLIENIFEQIAI